LPKVTVTKQVEPTYSGEVPASQLEILEALNWYNANMGEQEAAKTLKCDVKDARNFLTLAWAIRMKKNGFIFSDAMNATINAMQAKYDEVVVVVNTTVPTVNLQERISAKTDEYIGELEGMVDDYGFTEQADQFNAYDWFIKNEVKPIHAAKIVNYFKERATNLLSALEDKDKEYRAAHNTIGKNKVKNILLVMTNIVVDAERLASNVNKSRKPRKKKAVNFQKLASKVIFKAKDDAYKIQSIDPVNIIGSSQLWIFNTKTKRLAVYTAEDDAGLFLKGSKIVGFSVSKSYAKTLRKPEKVLNSVLNGGKIALRKIMDDITGKSFPLNGKLNKDTILLRIVK
jgi:hypothetical protein